MVYLSQIQHSIFVTMLIDSLKYRIKNLRAQFKTILGAVLNMSEK